MIEELFERLIGAIEANTAALLSGEGAAPKATPASGVKAPAAPTKGRAVADKPTLDMVRAAVYAVRDAKGKGVALKIVREAGGAPEINAIKPARFSAVLAACEEITGPAEEPEETEEDDGLD